MDKRRDVTRGPNRLPNGLLEDNFRFAPKPVESRKRIKAEREYYRTGELKAERLSVSRHDRWHNWDVPSADDLTIGGCLQTLLIFYVAGLSFCGSALIGLWIGGGIGGAALGLFVWVCIIIMFNL